ncbi:hypothetical protein Alches_14290 [Alicyclobacillus hesperidum subsp. aegles]|uniref:hypothetical protein n=1 Tax=Alicyclobacillus hesperidum TaxID=89784 RepID=UPI00222B1AD3|nr:hypothetical protein [Alicyclobacillus hesperidum]GLG01390.1 hypothetical protein Alches_14290 [Alicyclobacillus hesperidum subsp. aegles]
MKTLEGMQALDVATRYGITLYDTYYGNEVTVAEARQFIESRRDPSTFILKDWPDTEGEAEDVLLMHIYRALKEGQIHSGRVDLLLEGGPGPRINLAAAELAALRLADRRILEVEDKDDGVYYHVPQTTYLTQEFLSKLSEFVCDECRHMDLTGPFHETCLHALIDAIRRGQFTFEDIAEERLGEGATPLSRLFQGNLGQWSRRVSETKSKLQKAWKARRKAVVTKAEKHRDKRSVIESDPDWPTLSVPHRTLEDLQQTRLAARAEQRREETVSNAPSSTSWSQEPVVDAVSSAPLEEVADSVSETADFAVNQRERISKKELIAYLQRIEIVDESGDQMRQLADLKQRCIELEALLESANTRYDRLRSECEQWKAKYDDLQKDMDTVLQAMQIARKHASPDRDGSLS